MCNSNEAMWPGEVGLSRIEKALKYQGLCNTITKWKTSNSHSLWYKVQRYNVGDKYYVLVAVKKKKSWVTGACDKNHHQCTPQMYDLRNIVQEQDCKLLKVSYLVYFDWYEEIERKAQHPVHSHTT